MIVAATPSAPPAPSPRMAIIVMDFGSKQTLCPFFAKCGGVLVIDAAIELREFHRHDRATATSLCDLVLQLSPQRLVCGFIANPEKLRLRAAGIDVRLGSCACSVDELVAGFGNLTAA